jgi:hypothetical protein
MRIENFVCLRAFYPATRYLRIGISMILPPKTPFHTWHALSRRKKMESVSVLYPLRRSGYSRPNRSWIHEKIHSFSVANDRSFFDKYDDIKAKSWRNRDLRTPILHIMPVLHKNTHYTVLQYLMVLSASECYRFGFDERHSCG